MGIMGKTQGVKMEASPKPKATARNARSPSGGGGGGGRCVGRGGGARLGVSGGDDDGGGRGGRIDGEGGGAGPLGGHAHFGIAGLVAGGEGELGGAGGGVLFQLDFEEEGDVALVGFGVGIEVGVEAAFGRGLQGAEAGDGGVGRELDFGGNRGRGGHGIQVPAVVDAAGHADEHFAAGRRGGGLHAELPGDVLVLREQPAGEKKQCEDCRLHAKSVICNDFSSMVSPIDDVWPATNSPQYLARCCVYTYG